MGFAKEGPVSQERTRVQIDRGLGSKTITMDVQRATPAGHVRYVEALKEVAAWCIERQIENLKAAGAIVTTAIDPNVVLLAPLSKEQGLVYMILVNCAAIEGAVCRDSQGRPVVTDLSWPADMLGWTQMPGDVVEIVLRQVYALNPSWRPPHMSS